MNENCNGNNEFGGEFILLRVCLYGDGGLGLLLIRKALI